MIYYNELVPYYIKQKSYYNKAGVRCTIDNNLNTFQLFCDNLKIGFVEVAKITIDKKHASKNRYYITTDKKLLDAVTLKHIYDFIFQYYEHKTTKNKLFTRNKLVKNKVFKYALNLE